MFKAGHISDEKRVLNNSTTFMTCKTTIGHWISPANKQHKYTITKYKLDFVPGPYVKLWGGAVATIVPNDKEHVWGAVWRMQSDALVTLDKQEGVEIKQYFAKTVDVHIDNGKKAKCRTYQHLTTPPILDSLTNLPEDRRPSITYKKCIINGAIECSIPDEYIAKLKHIPDNGNYASDEIRKRLKF
ncbi:gamma-glutamylcyclotransferase [Helicoverpa armigera]|uniref:gamma-glutamylcyclotransferase n=1 Tax=Helicoverpa armigera TaxID=29058 RepID=UPI003083B4E6